MKPVDLKKEWLQILILAAPFCAAGLLWDKLPGWVPIHWNARGEVDGITRKAFGTLLLPSINIAIALLMGLLTFIDPKLRKLDADARASLWRTVRMIRLGITGFMSLLSFLMLGAAMEWFKDGAQFSYALHGAVAVLLMLVGNFMTKLRPNYFVGIRTPWTLESKEVWTKTHRVGGRLMMAGGLLMLVLCFFLPLEQYVYFVVIPTTTTLALFLVLYSYVLYKKQAISKPIAQ